MDEADVPDAAPTDDAEPEPSLEQLADDLVAVERAMERLEDGSYWSDEETGEPLPDDLLASDPTARRAPPPAPDTAPG
jgi:hypothetical protein